jgi:hypothetical protein
VVEYGGSRVESLLELRGKGRDLVAAAVRGLKEEI